MSTLAPKDHLISTLSPIFDNWFVKDFFDWNDKNFSLFGTTLPSANIKESDKDYTIDIAAPGLVKEDFKVELKHNLLTISSEKKEEKEETDEKKNYLRKEFSYQSFKRSFSLPDSADEGKVAAAYNDGILHIQVGKKIVQPTKQPKTIEVR